MAGCRIRNNRGCNSLPKLMPNNSYCYFLCDIPWLRLVLSLFRLIFWLAFIIMLWYWSQTVFLVNIDFSTPLNFNWKWFESDRVLKACKHEKTHEAMFTEGWISMWTGMRFNAVLIDLLLSQNLKLSKKRKKNIQQSIMKALNPNAGSQPRCTW